MMGFQMDSKRVGLWSPNADVVQGAPSAPVPVPVPPSATSPTLNPEHNTTKPPPGFTPSLCTDDDTYIDIHFKPLPGDIILSHKLEFEEKDKTKEQKKKKKKRKADEPPEPPLLLKKGVSLYHADFDEKQLQPGDYILRIGMFELRRRADTQEQIAQWCWRDLKVATLHVYWPNYNSKGSWFKASQFALHSPIRTIEEPDAQRELRKFTDDPDFKESLGDIVLRRFTIMDKTRPWGFCFDVWQLQESWDDDELQTGDILVHMRGWMFPEFRGREDERDPVFKLREALFRLEVDCCWLDPVSKKWLYAGQDAFCYKVKASENWITHERFKAVPKPGDVLITVGENLLRPVNARNHTGGYVQMYNDRRFFYPGDPPLKQVNVTGPGNIAIRFGHFNEHWSWTAHATVQVYHYHEKHNAWYTMGPVMLPRKFVYPPDYKFEQNPVHLNTVAADLVPRQGDILIRKPPPPAPKLKNPLEPKTEIRTAKHFIANVKPVKPHPFYKRIMVAVLYTAKHVHKYPLQPGDCLLRMGMEPAGPRSTAKCNGTAELYMLTLDHWDRKVWVFRGRDKVHFGGPATEEPPAVAEPRVNMNRRPADLAREPRDKNKGLIIKSGPQLVPSSVRHVIGTSRHPDDILIEQSLSSNKVTPHQFKEMFRKMDVSKVKKSIDKSKPPFHDEDILFENLVGGIKVTPKQFRELLVRKDLPASGSNINPSARAKRVSPQQFRQMLLRSDLPATPKPNNSAQPSKVSPKQFTGMLVSQPHPSPPNKRIPPPGK